MALNFPDSPSLNDIYTDSTSGFSYQWNGTVWISYSPSSLNNIKELDDISGSFNGINTIFALTVNATAVTPANAQQLIISLGGVIQNPNTDYSVSGSNIVFTTPPTSDLDFFGTSLGTAYSVGVNTTGDVYNRQTYSPTGITTTFTLSTGYTVGYLDVYQNGVRLLSGTDFTATDGSTFDLTVAADNGDEIEAIGYKVANIYSTEGNLTNLKVSGITTLGTVGAAGTVLLVNGDTRIVGVLTVGSSSITLNGTNNTVAIGSSITLDGTTGIITGAVYYGDGSNLTGVSGGGGAGIGSTSSINTTGIITASKIVATTFEGSGDNLIFSPSVLSYSPGIGSTGVSPTTNVVLTFNQQVQAGSGTVTLRTVSAGGTIVESFNVSTSSSITFSNNTVTLNPTGFLDSGTTYYTVFPQGTVQNYIGGNALVIDTYSFETSDAPLATTFSPAVGATTDAYSGNIVITYDQPITAGTGTITLRTGSRTGTIVESFDVTTDVTIVSDTLTINPSNDLGVAKYYVVIPAGAITNNIGLSVVDGQLDYYFITEGTLFAWGYNNQGSLGQNDTIYRSSPVQIPGTQWSSISRFGDHGSGATKTDGTLWAWGSNNQGQLAQNNTILYSSPIQIPGNQWSSIGGGTNHSVATKTDGTLWIWGYNNSGQLGQNNLTRYSSPVQIPGTNWSYINGGDKYSLATKTDGTLWGWGDNIYGTLGQNNKTYYSSPVQIPGNQWSSFDSFNQHALAIKTDGTLWGWGRNYYGQLGQGERTNFAYSSPVQIPGTTWSSVSSALTHSLATKTDGTLWSWGYNYYGGLGQNNLIHRSSPVQIPGNQWSSINGAFNFSSASKTDGTLWVWGFANNYGQLGLNDLINRSSPVQIPGTQWSSAGTTGNVHMLAIKKV